MRNGNEEMRNGNEEMRNGNEEMRLSLVKLTTYMHGQKM